MKGTADVVDGLRAEGFAVTRTYVAWLLRDRHIPTPEKRPGGALIWTDGDVQRLRSFLYPRNRGPEGAQSMPEKVKRCAKCRIVRRRGRVYIICENPKHKQRQG